jgi:hypothetical protein
MKEKVEPFLKSTKFILIEGWDMLLMTYSERAPSPHPLNHRTTYLRECELISDSVIGEFFFV